MFPRDVHQLLKDIESVLIEIREYLRLQRGSVEGLPLDYETDYDRVTVDLATARSDAEMGFTGLSLTFVTIGTGTWSLKFGSKTRTAINSTDVKAGDVVKMFFKEVYFTNTAQTVTNPVFWVGKRA